MSQIGQPSTASFTAQQSAGQVGRASDSYNELDIDSFLKLLISELQNQDPLDPMDNSEMVAADRPDPRDRCDRSS